MNPSLHSKLAQGQPMDSAEFFLRHVRRGAGVLSLMGPTKSWVDNPFDDVADALEMVKRFRNTHNVYVTMGTLRAGASQRRVQNIASLCGFFLDIDCHGKEGEASDANEACTALRRFCRETKIPKPSYVVASGHGLHAHWTSPNLIPVTDWERIAKKFKALTLASGLPADPTVTADPVRVLRIPNSFNFRDPQHPVKVEFFPLAGNDNFSVAEFERAVDEALTKAPSSALGPFRREPSALNRTLLVPSDYDITILDHALSYVSADIPRGAGTIIGSGGAPVSDYWLGVILAVRREYGEAGKEVARRWSQQSNRYDTAGFEHAWSQYKQGHPNPVTIGSVFMLARAKGWSDAGIQHPAIGVSRFRLFDRDAIMAQPPLRWRVKQLLPEVGIGAIYGPSGSGKSFLGIDLGISIAAGAQWFGHRTTACPVVYVILEGEAGLRNRVKAWEAHNAASLPSDFKAMAQSFQLAEPQQVEELGAILPKGGVVIIDTLNRSAPGLDENSSQDMGRILAGMKRLQELTEGLVIVVHHTGKDASKGLRGHSSLHAALDGAIEVERSAAGRCWSAAKVKDGEDGKQMQFKLHVVDLGTDADGDAVNSCAVGRDAGAVFRQGPPAAGKHQRTALSVIQRLLSASTDFGLAGAATDAPCIRYEDAITGVAGDIAGVDKRRRVPRAREAVQGLIIGGHLQRGLDASQDEWVWQ